MTDEILTSLTYQLMENTRQAVCLADVSTFRDWEHFTSLGNLRSWLGAPLLESAKISGFLSIGRITLSPFNKTEKDTAQVFASRIADALAKGEKKLAWKQVGEIKDAWPLTSVQAKVPFQSLTGC
jgi:signal transduction protein with GAF and PtsI domain